MKKMTKNDKKYPSYNRKTIVQQLHKSTSLDTCNTNETLNVMFYAEAEQTKNSTTLL